MILFRHKQEKVFNDFVMDVLPKIAMVSLSKESYVKLSELKNVYNLDFDDAYQCSIAEEENLTIITMDKDFKRVEKRISVKFI
ncbi:toxin-antitoxin system, toxin component, PIN family [delta proteobacterium NaphS2]|nr:toxin-antitoxin system, toxin component, PIN family [delta proteobacterium NaphS2]